jgi:hypothetical protein
MDYRILDLFMKENDAWEDMISRQKVELPLLDNLISGIMEDKKMKDDSRRIFSHLRHEMEVQEKNMEDLKKELEKQQKYLKVQRRRSSGDPYSINTFFSQKILRERIRDVERNFVELKCNYLNYIATI